MFIYYLSGILFILLSLMMFNLSILFMMNKINLFLEWNSFYLNSVMYNMYMYIDWMTLMFMFTVFMISSMIMFYSIEYMSHDMNNMRFFWMLFFFIMSMMLMIISPNILTILIGWDGLGLTSYCLIIYYQSKSSFNSGMLTVLINRLGDIFIIMSIGMMINFGSFLFLNFNLLNYLIMLFMMISAFTKSAQFPFSSWLPAAMAAPTPVSSLVHSSTLVTAGIYLMIRFNKIMSLNKNLMNFIMLIGLITMFMAGMSANFEFDLKKIIAYSTLSQLGLMMTILSINFYEIAFFHLIIHAMFKSMMFMCSGVIIHSMNNFQDIRFMGLLKNFLPMTIMMFMISNFSLCGMPFFSGFFSKDLLLEIMFLNKLNMFTYLILLISTMLTVMYSFRLIYYLLNNKFNFMSLFYIKDIKIMNKSMFILMIQSIMFGMILNWLLFMNIEYIFLLKLEKMMILIICLLAFILNIMFFKLMKLIKNYYFMKYFLGKMWFNYKFNYLLIIKFLKFGKLFSLIYDKGWSEEFMKIYVNNLNIKFKIFFNMNYNYFIYLMMILSIMSIFMFIF